MGCRPDIRRHGLVLAMLLLAAAPAGCAEPEDNRNPAEVLSIVAAGLEGVDRYTFRSRTYVRYEGIELQELASYEGEIDGHAVQAIRSLSDGAAWAPDSEAAPASRLAELVRQKAEIGFAEEAPECCLTLRVKLSGEAAAKDIKSRTLRQFEQAAEKAESGQEAAAAEEYRKAAAEETARFEQALNRMLDGLDAETTVLVTVDRRTMLPLKLEETSVIRYEAGGRPRTEEWVTVTTLDGFDGRPSPS